MVTRFGRWELCLATAIDAPLAISARVCRPFTIPAAGNVPIGAPQPGRSQLGQYSRGLDVRLRPIMRTPHIVEYQQSDSRCTTRLGRSSDLHRTQRRGTALVTKAELTSRR